MLRAIDGFQRPADNASLSATDGAIVSTAR
jgi:hypothetical protein